VTAVAARLQKPATAVIGLIVAMAASATWLLLAGDGNTFHGDELFYYAHLVTKNGVTAPIHGVEYFLAPHNGHLVLGGRLVYQLLYELVGTDYLVFRIVEVAGILTCAGLFFVLALRRTSPPVALALSISLLSFGYANETMMWPFDLHTVYPAVLGLAAFLALERRDRLGDALACLLLVLAVVTVEVGLAFTVGAAVLILQGEGRARRLWVFLLPLLLYLAWWVWAHKFGQSDVQLSNVRLIPYEFSGALAAVTGSLLGLNLTAGASPPEFVGVTPAAWVAAGFVVAGVGYRISRGKVPPTLWAFIATALAYWLTMAMGGRPPDSTRYVFVGAVLVLLVVVDAIRDVRFGLWATAAVFAVVLLAIPPNVAKLNDGRAHEMEAAKMIGSEYAMVDLAGDHVRPSYFPAIDPAVEAVGGYLGVALDSGNYIKGRERYGSLGMPLSQLRRQDVKYRQVADASLVGALRVRLHRVAAQAGAAACPAVTDATPVELAYFKLPRGGALLGSASGAVEIGVSRFIRGVPSVPLGRLGAGEWAELRIPPDAAPDPWRAVVSGPVQVCPLP
jgi:hypothetical protein